jgi:RNA polymerase sigma-70 factor (ECF subfamily)
MRDELIAKIREQDRDALDDLFSRHMQKAFAVSLHLCSGDREKAGDLTQEALLKAVRTIDSFKGKSSFSTWLYRIIYNTWLDDGKTQRRWTDIFVPWRWAKQKDDPNREILEETPDSDKKNNPLNAFQGKQFDGALRKALMALPEKQRIVFQFKVFNEMSIREIADIMNSAEGTVKTHLFRATQHLQKTLSDWK